MFFLPIIGPILQAILTPLTNILSKFWDTKAAMYQTDATVANTAITASAQTIIALKDDPGIRLSRDIFLFSTAMWYGLIVWDKIIEHSHRDWVITVSLLPDQIAYIPHMVLVFLFGVQIVNRFIK